MKRFGESDRLLIMVYSIKFFAQDLAEDIVADDDEKIEGHCPTCGGMRNARVEGCLKEKGSDLDGQIWWIDRYRILKCCGCGAVFYQHTYVFSEDTSEWQDPFTGEYSTVYNETVEHWPPPTKRQEPNWMVQLEGKTPNLYKILQETYGALNAGLRMLAAVGARTAFDSATEHLNIDPTLNFSEKLNMLESLGHIGKVEHSTLKVLVDAGGAAAHRGWVPADRQVETIIMVLEGFLHGEFIVQLDAGELGAEVPPRPKRKTR